MVEVLKVGSNKFVSKITCSNCKSTLSIVDGEWKDSGYGSERHINCPVCKTYIAKPGSEYRGDF